MPKATYCPTRTLIWDKPFVPATFGMMAIRTANESDVRRCRLLSRRDRQPDDEGRAGAGLRLAMVVEEEN